MANGAAPVNTRPTSLSSSNAASSSSDSGSDSGSDSDDSDASQSDQERAPTPPPPPSSSKPPRRPHKSSSLSASPATSHVDPPSSGGYNELLGFQLQREIQKARRSRRKLQDQLSIARQQQQYQARQASTVPVLSYPISVASPASSLVGAPAPAPLASSDAHAQSSFLQAPRLPFSIR